LLLLVVALITLGGLCSWCLWFSHERPRFSQEFDIGGGRTLRVWSIRDEKLFEPHALMIYYRVDAGGQEVIYTTFLDHDDEGEYVFRMVSANGGRLVCVYEVTRAVHNYYLFLIYDAQTGESWPRTMHDEGGDLDQAAAKWRERYRMLKAEHPELPAPSPLAK
jgi:hypothetical protein